MGWDTGGRMLDSDEVWALVDHLKENDPNVPTMDPEIVEWTEYGRQLGPESVKGTKFYNNGEVCVRRDEHPGEGWVVGRLPYKRPNKNPEVTWQKMSDALKGRDPWNKGKKNPYTPETLAKMSWSARNRKS